MACLFCRIVAGEIPASKVHEDADLVAFNDINPQAPLHVLIVPKQHISTTSDLTAADEALVGKLVRAAAAIAAEKGYAERRGWLTYLKVEPLLDPIRSDPRFVEWLRRMHLD